MNLRHQFQPTVCLHGETETTDSVCQNPRKAHSVFCEEHQPPTVDQCACGSTDIKRYLITSRFNRYPDEVGWVCPECLVNDAPGFMFYEDACEGEEVDE